MDTQDTAATVADRVEHVAEGFGDIDDVKRTLRIKSDTTIYALVKRGAIPAPVKLTAKCVRWWMPGLLERVRGAK